LRGVAKYFAKDDLLFLFSLDYNLNVTAEALELSEIEIDQLRLVAGFENIHTFVW
jgi:uncharacterized protein YuzE